MRRHGFTLIELLIVIGILAVLVAISVGAVFRLAAGQHDQFTSVTMQKVLSELDKQLKVVFDQAQKEPIPAAVVSLANGDERRARVIWRKLRLKQEFPTTYAEALNPAAGFLSGRLGYRQLPTSTGQSLASQSSACLLLALTQKREGIAWDAELTLGAGVVRDTDGDGVREIVDSWGTPLLFVRWPTALADVNPGGMQPGVNDAQDPEGLLATSKPEISIGSAVVPWPDVKSPLARQFTSLCHAVAVSKSYRGMHPVVISAGPNRKFGDGDDVGSYRLHSLGTRPE